MHISEIKHRIKSTRDIRQMTSALKFISLSKMKKALEQQERDAPYVHRVKNTLENIFNHTPDLNHEYLKRRGDKRTAYIVITSDKGLAGSYNVNVLNLAQEHMLTRNIQYVFCVGEITKEFLQKRASAVNIDYLHAGTQPTFENARKLARNIIKLYKENIVDDAVIVYTECESAGVHYPRILKLLPVEREDFIGEEADEDYPGEIYYEPSQDQVIDFIVPQYLIGMIYICFIEAAASEHSSRVMAMTDATKNADKILEKLNTSYHSLRQQEITDELISVARTDH